MFKHTGKFSDAVLTLTVWLATALVVGVFLWLLGDVLVHGFGKISAAFVLDSPQNAGRDGGIAPILVSTLLILAVALAVTLPLGLATAVYLSEYATDALAKILRISLNVLAGVPSIVFGLFGNALFCVALGMGFSIGSGGLTLACMMLPLFIVTTASGLSAVTVEWRSGALLFTSGYVDRMPESLSDSGRALSVHIYDLSMNVSGGDAAAYGSALVLMVLLLLINSAAVSLSKRFLRVRKLP